MLPPQGQTLIEIGAGYGRLADLYAGYETVVVPAAQEAVHG